MNITWITGAPVSTSKYGPHYPPGTLVRFVEGGIHLVGTVNQVLGACECCQLTERNIEAHSYDLVEMTKDMGVMDISDE